MLDWNAISRHLENKLDPKNVRKPPQGKYGDYIEGWHAIAEANRIFGFGAWSYSILSLECINKGPERMKDWKTQTEYDGWGACHECRVRVVVGDVVREDVGYGQGHSRSMSDALESSGKEAVTDALKRTFRTFGWPFGLALYDKSKENVGTPDVIVDRVPVEVQREAFRASLEPPHDPETGEAYDERNPPPVGTRPPAPEEDAADPSSVKDFMSVVREMAGPGATREQIEKRYAKEVIDNIARRKDSIHAQRWFDIFCELHHDAIGRIRDEALRSQVRSAIALKQAQIRGDNVDPADFGYPFGEPIVMGEVRIS